MDLLKKLGRQLPALIGLALLVGAVYVVWKEFRHLKIADIREALAAIPPRALLISFGWTILSYWVLTFYDRLGTLYAGHKVSYARVSFASFCAYSLSHNLGFAAVSGAAVRYRLYAHWGMTPFQIAKVVAFCSLTFTLGGLVLGGAILFFEPEAIPFFGPIVPRWVMYLIGAAMWALVLAYISLSRFIGTLRLFGHEVSLPDWRMALVQVTLASVDVAVTAAIFYALLPDAPGLTFLCSGCTTTSSPCSWRAPCSRATRSCCAAATCCGGARARPRAGRARGRGGTSRAWPSSPPSPWSRCVARC